MVLTKISAMVLFVLAMLAFGSAEVHKETLSSGYLKVIWGAGSVFAISALVNIGVIAFETKETQVDQESLIYE